MFRWLNDVPFTIDEYFNFFQNTIGPIVKDKLNGVTVNKQSTERIGGDMDAL